MSDPFNTLDSFSAPSGAIHFASLKKLESALGVSVSRLPVSIRIVLESVLRNCDGVKVTAEHVKQLANWKPNAERTEEIPFTVARVILQDFTGVPLLADLAAMRSAAERPARIRKRSSRWCRSTWWSTTPSRSTSSAPRTRSAST
jgi:aconitate hydratase